MVAVLHLFCSIYWRTIETGVPPKTRRSRKVIAWDRFPPGSKTCSHRVREHDEQGLDARAWMCPKCGTYPDRDLDAAENLVTDIFVRLPDVASGTCTLMGVRSRQPRWGRCSRAKREAGN